MRLNLLDWSIEALLDQGLAPAAHHRLLIENLQWLADTPDGRLMVFMPPGSAKSTYASVLFPAWWLATRPNTAVLGVSYGSTLAETFSKRVQSTLRDNAGHIGAGPISDAADRWRASNGSEYRCSGIGAGITGFRGDLVVIDDPVRGREAADSELMRQKTWDQFTADIYSRGRPGMRALIIQTRWHEDDLSGRILSTDPGGWRVLKLPAFAEESDALGRVVGEPLWSDDEFGYASNLIARRQFYERAGAMRDWESLYQQNPRPPEGSLFKVGAIEIVGEAPNLRKAIVCRGWDLAATRQSGTNDPDWTVGVKLARMEAGQFLVLDVVRFRGGPDEVDQTILNTAALDGAAVQVSIPQDPGQAGKTQALAFTRLLSGFRVHTSGESGDKATRAAPVVSQVNGGNFAMVRAPWNAAFRDELSAFPSGRKDDQVDALSRAFSVIGVARGPLVVSDDLLKALGRRR